MSNQTIVISQSMYFPWCGLLDQMAHCDVFVHYDDVQFARGFYNRVQMKTEGGVTWLTVPLHNRHRGQLICETRVSYATCWVMEQRNQFIREYKKAQFLDDAVGLFDSVHQHRFETLGDLSRASIRALSSYFCLENEVTFLNSAELDVSGRSSRRLLEITRKLGGGVYLTGHGAMNYLEHDLFEEHNVEVRYMQYRIAQYPQFHGPFTPYVTSLDAVAHLGPNAKAVLQSATVNWRDAIGRPNQLRP